MAHEIGHAHGAKDIYSNDCTIEQTVLYKDFTYSCAMSDWSNGCGELGAGYYTRGVKCGTIIDKLLMKGTGVSGRDITAGSVYGAYNASQGAISVGDVNVGFVPVQLIERR